MMDLMSMSQQDFVKAIALAKKDGNLNAIAQLRQLYGSWQSAKDRELYDPTKGMSTGEKVAANLGAGMMNVVEGTKQLFGATSPEDIREKEARDRKLADSQTLGGLTQGVGMAAALAPAAFIPGANTVAGAAAIGGGIGAISPTSNENVAAGKATNAALGAAAGGAMQKGAQMVGNVAPKAYNAVLDWWSKKGLPGASPQRQTAIADRAFAAAVPGNARTRLMGYQEQVPGVRTSTAAALGDEPLLAVDRATRETAGPAANIMRQQELSNNAARWNYLQDIGGDVSKAKKGAWDWFAQQAAKLKPRGTIDPNGKLVSNVDLLIDQYGAVSPTAKTALEQLRESLANALRANGGKGDIGQLHKVRMYVIDDKLSALTNSDMKVAGSLRTVIGGPNGIKSQLDEMLNGATSGRWSKLMQGFAARRQIADQLDNANALVGKVGSTNTSVTGEPVVSSSMRMLRKAAPNPPEPRYGHPTYLPRDAARIAAVTADTERQLMPFKLGVAPKNSATAANVLERGPAGLMDTMRQYPHMQVSDPVAAIAGGMATGSPGGAVVGIVGNEARKFALARSDAARDVIASRIATLLADQAEAYKLLESLNPVVRAAVAKHFLRRQIPMTGAPGAIGAGGGLLGAQAGSQLLGASQ